MIMYCSFLGTSTVNLRLETAKEQVTAFAETGADQPHEMTPAVLIRNGLDLEDQQYGAIEYFVLPV
jgi:hypothetical protein